MATADILCIVVLVVFGFIGVVRGFFRQVTSLAAFALIALVAVPVGVAVAEWPSPSASRDLKIGMSFVVALVIYAAVKLAGLVLSRAVQKANAPDRTLAPPSRCWGGTLGVIKAGILCWLVLCYFMAFPGIRPRTTASVRRAWSAKTTKLWNPFARWIRPATPTPPEEP